MRPRVGQSRARFVRNHEFEQHDVECSERGYDDHDDNYDGRHSNDQHALNERIRDDINGAECVQRDDHHQY